ncbi:MAG: hypothetical protein QOJ68_719 [Blastococcus sp.]|nr:hypothetical protein [Blastococcus sp.]
MVLVVILLSHLLAPRTGSPPAAASTGATSSARGDLPVLPVAVPPVTPATDASCPKLMSTLPFELTGETSRRVRSDTPYAYAWGDPPIVLRCGVPTPAGFVVGTGAIQINGIQWYVDTSDPAATVWTTVDRPVGVEVRVPASLDSASVTELTGVIAKSLPFREPTPRK